MINKRSNLLSVRLTDAEMNAVEKIVNSTELSKSDVGRLAIIKLLNLDSNDSGN